MFIRAGRRGSSSIARVSGHGTGETIDFGTTSVLPAQAVNAPHLVALVRTGARFDNGKLIERLDESGGEQHAT